MIPMPGHPTSESTVSEVRDSFETLVQEVKDCDVMFLLLDTRESRWLPTVLGQKYQKVGFFLKNNCFLFFGKKF